MHGEMFAEENEKQRFIKSPRYIGGDYVFVPVRTPPPAADSCSRDNFWTTFWISLIFGTIVGPDV